MGKLQEWKLSAHRAPRVSLDGAVDVTTPPSAIRASFPYDILPPMRVLRKADILRELVKLPSTDHTCCLSAAFGALLLHLIRRLLQGWGWGSPTPSRNPQLPWPALRLALLSISLAAFVRFVRSRRPTVADVSHPMDVSSDPAGPCCVTTRVLTLSNSHAGTHADTPHHFLSNPAAAAYDDVQYTGAAVLVDLSCILREANAAAAAAGSSGGGGAVAVHPNAITAEVLRTAEVRYGIEWPHVVRLLAVTRNPHPLPLAPAAGTPLEPVHQQRAAAPQAARAVGSGDEDAWDADFAHLSVDGADYLCENAPQLLLFGIDTPSVDHPSASPICKTAHGRLWSQQVAILENLDFRNLFHLLASDEAGRRVEGAVQTVFNAYQCFRDSRGCSVIFYPPRELHAPSAPLALGAEGYDDDDDVLAPLGGSTCERRSADP